MSLLLNCHAALTGAFLYMYVYHVLYLYIYTTFFLTYKLTHKLICCFVISRFVQPISISDICFFPHSISIFLDSTRKLKSKVKASSMFNIWKTEMHKTGVQLFWFWTLTIFLFLLKTQCFGAWFLSLTSGGTYLFGPSLQFPP